MPIAAGFHLGRLRSRLKRLFAGIAARGWLATLRGIAGRRGATSAAGTTPAPGSDDARPAPRGPRLLVVDVDVPHPDRDSGSVRLSNLLRLLVAEGYRVTFFADDGHREGADARALRAMGVDVATEPALAWLRRHGAGLQGAILCRHFVAGHWVPAVRHFAPGAHVVFDTVDLHFLREARQASVTGTRGTQRRALATKASELALVGAVDTTWVVSADEQRILAEEVPGARVEVVSNTFGHATAGPAFADRRDLLFVGGHRHPPNTDAAWWLVREIFPAIRRQLPDVRLHLVGADVPRDLRTAAEATGGIVVHGHVPDLAPLLAGCRVAIAPLRFGAGVKGKVNLSMARGLPVVTTPCGAEGMHVRDGVHAMVASDAGSLAAAVVRVYGDPVLWERLAANGLENVRRHFSFEAARAALRRTFAAEAGAP